jgi:hypothetical protein
LLRDLSDTTQKLSSILQACFDILVLMVLAAWLRGDQDFAQTSKSKIKDPINSALNAPDMTILMAARGCG